MFHVVGSTPEASTLEEALHGMSAPDRGRDALGAAGGARRADERRTAGRWRRSVSARRMRRRRSSIATHRCWTAGGSMTGRAASSRPAGTSWPPSRSADIAGSAPVCRRRAAGRHLLLHLADPAPAPRTGDDRLGEVGVLRAGQHRCRGRASGRSPSASTSAVAGHVVRHPDGATGERPAHRPRLGPRPGAGPRRAASLWGGLDPATGADQRARHPQHGAVLTGRDRGHAGRARLVLVGQRPGRGRPRRHRAGRDRPGRAGPHPGHRRGRGRGAVRARRCPIVVAASAARRVDHRWPGGRDRSARGCPRSRLGLHFAEETDRWMPGHRCRRRIPRSGRSSGRGGAHPRASRADRLARATRAGRCWRRRDRS